MADQSNAILGRRLASFVYDTVLVIAILLIALLPWSIAGITPGHPYYPALTIYVYAIAAFYFVWFWTHGGQTPGMKTWKLRVADDDGGALTLPRAWLRLAAGTPSVMLLGAGLIIAVFSRDKRTWYDKCSRSRVLREQR